MSWRAVHLPGGAVWGWWPGRSGVRLRDPGGQGSFVRWEVLLSMSIEDVERAKRKRVFAVGPAVVRDYLLRKDQDAAKKSVSCGA